jgi:diguanylate cyclase (GGDEF)-like protein/PAS domain S-box-containing protein
VENRPLGIAARTSDLTAALERVLETTPNGVTVADLRLPDQPVVYANPAFAELAGLAVEEILGRNCRFLQGADTDPADVATIRTAIRAGEQCRVTLLNHRGPDREPWWNDLHLVPVTDDAGRVVQYVGLQQDVTARVQAERALERARDRMRADLARLEELADSDPLTGLLRRRRFEELIEAALWNSRAEDDGLALIAVGVDGLTTVESRLGPAVGDTLLRLVADRLRGRLRRKDLVTRLGPDEFLVALPHLSRATATDEADRLAGELAEAAAVPVTVHGHEIRLSASAGIGLFPGDGDDVTALLRAAMRRVRHEPTGTL